MFLGFIFEENSSGGAKIDHEYLLPFIDKLYLDFDLGLNNFLNNSGSLIHSPIFYILVSFFYKITGSLFVTKISYLILSLYLPFLFYLILSEKYKNSDQIIFYLTFLIFLSPYFRSSAIWLLGDNLSLIFFSSSILFLLRHEQSKEKTKYIFLSICFLAACCYVRYYYCVFFIYYLFYFFKNLDKKLILNVLVFSFLLSTPALLYFYYIILEYNFLKTLNTFGGINYLNSGMIILSIILFYLFPFVMDKEMSIIKYYKNNLKIFFLILSIFFIFYVIGIFLNDDLINLPLKGGGVLVKLIRLSGLDEISLIIFFSCISLLILEFLFKDSRLINYLLLILLIGSLPLLTIYQKYLDPLVYLIFFGLIKSKYLNEIILRKKINLRFIFFYFFSFYFFSLFYYL